MSKSDEERNRATVLQFHYRTPRRAFWRYLPTPPHLKAIAGQFWTIGEGVAAPFSVMQDALWPEGAQGPANPEQAFRRDLREVRVISRILAHGSGKMLDFRQNAAGDWLVRVRANH